MSKYAADITSHRNWDEEQLRYQPFVDNSITVTPMTPEQLEQFRREKEAYLRANLKASRKQVGK